MHRRRPVVISIRAISVLALAVSLASCGGPAVPTSEASPVTTPAPTIGGTGMLHLTTTADYDPHDPLRLKYILADGQIAADVDAIEPETIVVVDRQLPAGPVRVVANDTECTGTIPIETNLEVDAVLAVDNGTCAISIAASHAPGAMVHPEPRTALGAMIEVDSILVVKPLDPGNATAEIQLPADDRGSTRSRVRRVTPHPTVG
jgi:hypothetical protein